MGKINIGRVIIAGLVAGIVSDLWVSSWTASCWPSLG